MNAVERLTAAIEKLEALKADATPGVWRRAFPGGNREADVIDVWSDNAPINEDFERADAELIVTLHRTIDAQLRILNYAVVRLAVTDELLSVGDVIAGTNEGALALADAILGEVTS